MTHSQDQEIIFDGISLRLREERAKSGLTQAEFAHLGGTSLPTQTRYEAGQNLPKLDYLYRLATQGVDAGYIVTGVRSDGTIHPLEQSFLNNFRRLDDENKAAVMYVTQALLSVQGDDMSNEAWYASRVAAALVDYTLPTTDEFVRKVGAARPSTLHNPVVPYRSEPLGFKKT